MNNKYVAFSVLADFTRDKTNDKNLCIKARFVLDNNIYELCFAINKLNSENAKSISDSIFTTLVNLKIFMD